MKTFLRINVEAAQKKLKDRSALFIDIRDYISHAEGHIAPSFYLDESGAETLINLTPKDCPLILYCYHGHSSQTAAQFLVEKGFSEVYNLEGGYAAWVDVFGTAL